MAETLFTDIINNLGKSKVKVTGSGSKTGKQQIEGAPKGITSDKETINLQGSAEIPITNNVDFLLDGQYNKFRDNIEYKDNQIFLEDAPSNINKKVGIGINKGGEGFGGYAKYDIDNEKPEFFLGYKKTFADGGSTNGSEAAALRKKVEELMDDGYEFGEAVREAMRQGYGKGGIVDFKSARKLANNMFSIRLSDPNNPDKTKRVAFTGTESQVREKIKQHNLLIKKKNLLLDKTFDPNKIKNYAWERFVKDINANKSLLEIAEEIYKENKEFYDSKPKKTYGGMRKPGVVISPTSTIRNDLKAKLDTKYGGKFTFKKLKDKAAKTQIKNELNLKQAKTAAVKWIKTNTSKYKNLAEGKFGKMKKDFYAYMEKNFPKVVKYSTGRDLQTTKGEPYIKNAGSLFETDKTKTKISLSGVEKNVSRVNNMLKKALDIPINTNIKKTPDQVTKTWTKYYKIVEDLLPEAQKQGFVPKFFINKQTNKKVPITAKNYMSWLTRNEPAVMKEIFGGAVKFSPEHASGIKRAGLLKDFKALGTVISQEYGERTNKKGVPKSANLIKGIYLDRNIDLNLRKAVEEATTLEEKKAFVKKADDFAARAEKEYGVKQARYSVGKDGKIKIKSPNVSLTDDLLKKTKNSISTFIANDGMKREVFKKLPLKLQTAITFISEGRNANPLLKSHLKDVIPEYNKGMSFRLSSFPAQLAELPKFLTGAVDAIRDVDYSKMQLGTGKAATAAGMLKNVTKFGGKALGYAAIPLTALELKNMHSEGKTAAEMLAYPFFLEGRVAEAQDLLKMTPVERQALMNEQIAEDFSDMDSDFYTPPLEGLGAVDTQMVKERVAKERAKEEEERKALRNKRLPNAGILDIVTNSDYEGVI